MVSSTSGVELQQLRMLYLLAKRKGQIYRLGVLEREMRRQFYLEWIEVHPGGLQTSTNIQQMADEADAFIRKVREEDGN